MKTKKIRRPLKARQKKILLALRDLGGIATTREIAKLVKLHVNGVSQSFSALEAKKHVKRLGGKGGDAQWQLEICMSEL